jgi:hypothetical protein
VSTAEDVSRIALSLPEAKLERSGFHVRGKGFAWTYMERTGPGKPRIPRPDVLAVRVSGEGEKQLLLASDPSKFFTTDHYNGYPAILVRLPAIDPDELTELITDAWRLQAPRALVKALDASSPSR